MNEAVEQMIEAARRELAQGGLRKMSFRRLGDAVGATSGALSYHLGAKSDILFEVVQRERERDLAWHAVWLERFKAVGSFDRLARAAVFELYLDSLQYAEARTTGLIWMDLILRARRDEEASALIKPWLVERRAFWQQLFAGRVEEAALWADLAMAYTTDEGFNGLALGEDPDYRLLRRLCVERLAGRLERGGLGNDAVLHHQIGAIGRRLGLISGEKKAVIMGPGPRREAALAACFVLIGGGSEALTHRAVSEMSGLSRSAVGYYYRSVSDLFGAAISGVYLVASGEGELPPSMDGPDPVRQRGMAVARGELAVVLAAARDPQLRPYALDQRRWRGSRYGDLMRSRGYADMDDLDGQVGSLVATGLTLLLDVDGIDRREPVIGWMLASKKL